MSPYVMWSLLGFKLMRNGMIDDLGFFLGALMKRMTSDSPMPRFPLRISTNPTKWFIPVFPPVQPREEGPHQYRVKFSVASPGPIPLSVPLSSLFWLSTQSVSLGLTGLEIIPREAKRNDSRSGGAHCCISPFGPLEAVGHRK